MSNVDSEAPTQRSLLGWVRACLTTLEQLESFCQRYYPSFLTGFSRPLTLARAQGRLAETYPEALLGRLWSEFPDAFPSGFCPPGLRANDNDDQGDLALGLAIREAFETLEPPTEIHDSVLEAVERWRQEQGGADPTGVRKSGQSHLRLLLHVIPGASEAVNGGSAGSGDPDTSE